MKIPEMNNCKCGKTPILSHYVSGDSFFSFIYCSCGMLTKSFSSKKVEISKKNCILAWNKKALKRTKNKTTGIKSCEKCGSKVVSLDEYKMHGNKSTFMVRCSNCGIQTDEMNDYGIYLTKKEALELWNK